MGKTWVLDTETKGTGAEMVPLERKRVNTPRERLTVIRRAPAGEDAGGAESSTAEQHTRRPRKFKVTDVVSRQVLLERASAQEAIHLLEGIRSVVDVRIYVREGGAGEWRPLNLREKKLLWRRRRA